MEQLFIRSCYTCHKLFLARSSYLKHRATIYCSKSCFSNAPSTQINRICKYCSKPFHVCLSRASTAKFCSRSCKSKFYPVWNQYMKANRIRKICPRCSKVFHVVHSANIRRRYCSNECRIKYNPRPCVICHKVFAPTCRTEKRPMKYCSPTCYRIATGNVSVSCRICHREFMCTPYKARMRKFCSRRCYRKYALSLLAKRRPTNAEGAVIRMIDEYKLPLLYTGNGSLTIGIKNPDFIHQTQKKVVEVFGDFFHSPLYKHDMVWHQTFDGTTRYYKQRDYECLIIWQSDLSDPEVATRLLTYCRSSSGSGRLL